MDEPTNDRQISDRGPHGRFAPGNKLSPGRPRGRGPVAELRATLATDLHQIIDTLRAQALAGDAQAIRIILDRVLPSLRPIELPAMLTMPTGGTLTEQAQAVIQAAAAGELSPGQAAQVVAALSSVAKIIETTDLLRRIEALEARKSISFEKS